MRKLFPILIIMLSLTSCDNKGDFDSILDSSIIDFIQKEYKGATIRSAEYEDNGLYEVEIKHDSHIKDLYFDIDNNWVYTTWDVKKSDLPNVVKDAISEKYSGYRIDDIDFIENVEKSYYKIELEKGDLEQTVYISPNGDYEN